MECYEKQSIFMTFPDFSASVGKYRIPTSYVQGEAVSYTRSMRYKKVKTMSNRLPDMVDGLTRGGFLKPGDEQQGDETLDPNHVVQGPRTATGGRTERAPRSFPLVPLCYLQG